MSYKINLFLMFLFRRIIWMVKRKLGAEMFCRTILWKQKFDLIKQIFYHISTIKSSYSEKNYHMI